MACHNPACVGNYDFDNIADLAKKRFVDGYNTIDLLTNAQSEKEKEEIVFVSLLDIEDNVIQDLQLSCKHRDKCFVTECRSKLKQMIEDMLVLQNLKICVQN